MRGLKLAIVLGFACMFVAGVAVDRRLAPAVAPRPQPAPSSWMARELNLSPTQQAQMHKIWADAAAKRPDLSHQFQEADRQRDDAIHALFTPEQWTQYQQILHAHSATVAALRAQAQKPIRDAEQATRQILTPEQLKKFNEILKQHGHHRGGPRAGMRNRARANVQSPPPTQPSIGAH